MSYKNPNQQLHTTGLRQISQVAAYGGSQIAGTLTSDPMRDLVTRFAAMVGAKEVPYATPGAILMWSQDLTNNEFGIMGHVLQTWKRPVRAASTIATVDPAVGATVLTLAQAPNTTSATGVPFKVEDHVAVGTGSNSEIARITAVSSTQITLAGFQNISNVNSGLVNDHAIGEPVYVVPTYYGASNTISLASIYGNQLFRYNPGVYAAASPGQNAETWFKEAFRMFHSRLRAAEVYEPDHTALTFSGSWSAGVFSQAASGSTAAQGARGPSAVNASVTFHVPNNFPGGAISFNFLNFPGSSGGGVWTFTVDGSAAGTLTQIATPTTPRNKQVYFCKRFTGLSAGRHTIVAQMTTYEANTSFDCAVIEAADPPIIVNLTKYRMPTLDGIAGNSGVENSYLRTTLASQANSGATSISVNQTTVSNSRQITAASIPKVGEYITLDRDTALEETRQVSSVTGASAPYTINLSGGGLTNTHPTAGSLVEMGANDYVTDMYIQWMHDVRDEFDENIVMHSPQSYIQANEKWFAADRLHFNDEGTALVAQKIYEQLNLEKRLDTRAIARLSRPTMRVPQRIEFFRSPSTVTTWSNITGTASIELFGVTHLRSYMDMTSVYEGRLIVQHGTLATPPASNLKMRCEYSIDGGTTWRALHRISSSSILKGTATNWQEPSTANGADLVFGEIDLLSTLPSNAAPKIGNWAPVYPEVTQYDNTMLRIIVVGGNGTVDIPIGSVAMELR